MKLYGGRQKGFFRILKDIFNTKQSVMPSITRKNEEAIDTWSYSIEFEERIDRALSSSANFA